MTTAAAPASSASGLRASGVASALAAYGVWGLFPAWWKQLVGVPPLDILAHRILWSFLFVAGLLTVGRGWQGFRAVLSQRRTFLALLASTALISTNWLLYVWAVNSGRVMEGSLGYYINPLVNVLLARVVLGERLRPLQQLAVGLAALGVGVLALGVGGLPWVSLALAVTVALYGLVRKLAPVAPLTGLAVETGLAAPLALGVLGLAASGGSAVLGDSPRQTFFLVGSGVATALPLLWFAAGAKQLRFSTLGIFQYVSPTLQLALAVLAYGETFTSRHAVTFALIWAAVGLYLVDALRAPRPAAAPAAAASR